MLNERALLVGVCCTRLAVVVADRPPVGLLIRWSLVRIQGLFWPSPEEGFQGRGFPNITRLERVFLYVGPLAMGATVGSDGGGGSALKRAADHDRCKPARLDFLGVSRPINKRDIVTKG